MNRQNPPSTPELRRACASLLLGMKIRISASDDEDEGSTTVVNAVQAMKLSASNATSSNNSVTNAVSTPVTRKSTRLELRNEESVKCVPQATPSEEELRVQLIRGQLRDLSQHLTRLILEKKAAEYETSRVKKAIYDNDHRVVKIMQQLQEHDPMPGEGRSWQENRSEKHLALDRYCSVHGPVGGTDLEVPADVEVDDVDVVSSN
ncbi:hypothetical protein AAVH_05644 [Aphelenchoides avenae]|nr:hypothetical protein AAVH_05644 [Aphelenchus avenae]